ncbi:MAG: 50S ribosomal protein L30 [Caldilinea sp.]|jgi:large subunit ribosomal protein L30|nr:50S ribosomal protein L30 [Caldilinea sp.]MCB0056176.1 50S ribosomal protein L30 [Caldilineaceae bacterium]MCB0038338.1 50S ribosomal protein L30 [Caldilinea sp.]MCB0050802.1 50S ribosomal protein L30 [Caldilinea sp.]MCB0066453.1 50S ribosomal protein L30 [Caldilineaceae bacterium]
MAEKQQAKVIRIKLVRSPIGYTENQKRTVKALGLRKLNQVVEKEDSPAVRGMINTVSHMLEVSE